MLSLLIVFENYFAQEFLLFPYIFFILEDNKVNVKDVMEALRDTLKFSNFVGKSFMGKLFKGSSSESFRGPSVKHHNLCLFSTHCDLSPLNSCV